MIFQRVDVVGEDYCEATLKGEDSDSRGSESNAGFDVKPIVMCVAFNFTYRFSHFIYKNKIF
jgi:hypothetical protein